MRIAIVTARDFADAASLESALDRLTQKLKFVVVHSRRGGKMAHAWACHRGHTYLVFQPDETDEAMLAEADGVAAFGSDAAVDALVELACEKGLKVRRFP